ncbi:MAG TPA: S8 family serine peptidase, partial [Acidimicrobiales bacterium]|nr:S8 family serine peptidase [Acidimicrobiales bacterium]
MTKQRVGAGAASLALALVLLASMIVAAPAGAEESHPVLVTFTTASAAQQAVMAAGGGRFVAPTIVSFQATTTELDALGAQAGVIAVEPDLDYHATALSTTPNDPCLVSAANCSGIDAWQFGEIGIADLWARTHGASVTIAIVDGGVDQSVADLQPKLAGPEIDLSTSHDGPSDHGTTVAALAAAATDNALGSAGIAWDSRILSIKVLDKTGTGKLSSVAAGVVRATDLGARVINLSLSGQNTTALATAVQYALDRGVVVVAAAGNDGTDKPVVSVNGVNVDGGYPARYPGVIGVGASAPGHTVAPFSDFGSWVDVYAPGTDLPAPVVGGALAKFSGTSAAAPIVSGVAALLVSADPALQSADVAQALQASGAALTGRLGAVEVDASALASQDALFPPAPNSPVGVVDGVGPYPGGAVLTGWTIDPNTVASLDVHTYVDGHFAALTHAGDARPDVALARPGFGPAHGFTVSLALAVGTHSVCTYGINQGAGVNALIGCVPVVVTGLPFGAVDGTARTADIATLTGWVIDPSTIGQAQVQLVVDGIPAAPAFAAVVRPDVLAAYPWFGAAHGYRIDTVVSSGPHTICVLGLTATASRSVGLGCR